MQSKMERIKFTLEAKHPKINTSQISCWRNRMGLYQRVPQVSIIDPSEMLVNLDDFPKLPRAHLRKP